MRPRLPSLEHLAPALFFLSGLSALGLETVWFRWLRLALGSTVEATGTVLTVFMAGLALGALLGGRLADRLERPVLVYGLLEALVGLWALITIPLVGLLPSLYGLLGGEGSRALLRFLVITPMLLVPTTAMGATLPVLSRALARRHVPLSRTVGTLYGLNLLVGRPRSPAP